MLFSVKESVSLHENRPRNVSMHSRKLSPKKAINMTGNNAMEPTKCWWGRVFKAYLRVELAAQLDTVGLTRYANQRIILEYFCFSSCKMLE